MNTKPPLPIGLEPVLEAWIADLKAEANSPDTQSDGRNFYAITDLGRELRARDGQRLEILNTLIQASRGEGEAISSVDESAARPASPVCDQQLGTPLDVMIGEAVRFSFWAAGEGICPVDGQPARAPEDFLMEYSDATGDVDWETLADRLTTRPQPKAEGK